MHVPLPRWRPPPHPRAAVASSADATSSTLLRSACMPNVTRSVTAVLGLVRKASSRGRRNRVRADQQVDSHLPLALHLNCAALAQLKPMSEAFIGPLCHLDRAGQRVI